MKKRFAYFIKKLYLCGRKCQSGCSTVGSAPRSGRGGRKFESSHPDIISVNGCSSLSYAHFPKIAGTKTEHAVFFTA